MVFDLDLIKKTYAEMPAKVDAARKALGRPLTLAEKILYAHLWKGIDIKDFKRGKDYVDFAPDRVAMQDATAQMALLQFDTTGRKRSKGAFKNELEDIKGIGRSTIETLLKEYKSVKKIRELILQEEGEIAIGKLIGISRAKMLKRHFL